MFHWLALFYDVATVCFHCDSAPPKGLGVESSSIDEGCRECFEIGKANLASHLRRAIGADVEAFASPEERILETIPDPFKGSGLEGI